MPSIVTIARFLEGGDADATCAPCATSGTACMEKYQAPQDDEAALIQARRDLLETSDGRSSALVRASFESL